LLTTVRPERRERSSKLVPDHCRQLVLVIENCAAGSSEADPHDRDVLFEDERIHYLAADINVRLHKMGKPVNFDYVRFTSNGRAYFQDPDCPDWIQVVENYV